MPILEETSAGYRLVRLLEEDAAAALRIFNEHAATGYAAYMEEPAPEPARVTILAWTRGEIALVLIGKANLTQLMDIGQEINEAAGAKQSEAHAPALQS